MHARLPLAGLILLAGALAACRPHPDASSPAALDAINASASAVLQGDSVAALDALRTVPAAQFAGRDAEYRDCMLERFGGDGPPAPAREPADPLARDLLRAYRTYWRRALAAPAQRRQLEETLHAQVRGLLGDDTRGTRDWPALETRTIEALRRRGVHALMGRTPPLLELMLWRRQETRDETVALPDGRHTVAVHYLDDFDSLGWSAYARCERGSTGGWATHDGLYAVVPAYDRNGGLDSETFRVVFFAHEAQHFADKHRYPPMEGWEYEYRAKLVELALGESAGDERLRGFASAQSDDPDSPHTYANRRVMRDLQARLGTEPGAAPRAQRQAAALALLREDSARRAADAGPGAAGMPH
ncbi:hypothetical protein LDO32_17215 [Luteimonas sp. Y-2-2-4F]|nr:hypothetical protein [Luteimonas sp. Y-2-2-4F]MCD9033456.1 hypothetical protein [Luteimonas sp. Y-2-2-4F]